MNTQAILQELHRTNEISADTYSSYVEQLALLNYGFLRITAKDIIRRLEASSYVTTEGTRAMLRTLEGPDCSEDSAVSVGTDLIASIAGKAPPEQTDVLVEVVIAMLRRGRNTGQVLLKFRDKIASDLALAPFSSDQILRTVDLYIELYAV